MTRLARQAAEARGRRGETLALLSLVLKGWRPLQRRVKTPVGEIDLVMRRGRHVAFVEVKHRPDLASALEAVTPHAQARIGRAARWWLARHPRYGDHAISFDVVAVVPGRWPKHIANAFLA
jgi:putative endonuclease